MQKKLKNRLKCMNFCWHIQFSKFCKNSRKFCAVARPRDRDIQKLCTLYVMQSNQWSVYAQLLFYPRRLLSLRDTDTPSNRLHSTLYTLMLYNVVCMFFQCAMYIKYYKNVQCKVCPQTVNTAQCTLYMSLYFSEIHYTIL